MSRRKMTYLLSVSVVLALSWLGWKFTARTSYETARYVVVKSAPPFEVRQYPDLMLATTDMAMASQGEDGSFMRLFRYISGTNADGQKIAMTTPVFMQAEHEAAPGQMGFLIPDAIVERGVPEPTSEAVNLRQRSGGQFAVIRFKGAIDRESIAMAERRLRTWMKDSGFVGGEMEVAGYDPPWTPGWLRRNEVLIRCD